MPVVQIPHNEWDEFFASFSRQHEGWLVTIEVLQPRGEVQLSFKDVSLQKVTIVISKGKEILTINMGERSGKTQSLEISSPSRIFLCTNTEGAHEELRIESLAGKTTVLRFRSPMLPEMVDGYLPG
jgi:uncharacterized protein DUF5335